MGLRLRFSRFLSASLLPLGLAAADALEPRFVRVMGSLAKTGTFKIQKNDLRKEGVDPATVADPLYVRTSGGYEMLTPERWTDVKEGRLKL